jgi:hypothetical protein
MTFLAGGLWIIPLLILEAAVFSFIRGYKQSKSGSLEEGETSGSTRESNINVPFWKCTATIYGYIFTVALIVALIVMYNDK